MYIIGTTRCYSYKEPFKIVQLGTCARGLTHYLNDFHCNKQEKIRLKHQNKYNIYLIVNFNIQVCFMFRHVHIDLYLKMFFFIERLSFLILIQTMDYCSPLIDVAFLLTEHLDRRHNTKRALDPVAVRFVPSKHEALAQCRADAGPES